MENESAVQSFVTGVLALGEFSRRLLKHSRQFRWEGPEAQDHSSPASSLSPELLESVPAESVTADEASQK